MKKLIVLLMLVLAGSAFASVNTDIVYSVVTGGASEITIDTSDTIYIDVSVNPGATGDAEYLIDSGELWIEISGNAVFTQNTDLTWISEDDIWYDPDTNYEYVSSTKLRVRIGSLALAPGRYNDEWLDVDVMPQIIIDHIGIHCTGLGNVTVSLTADTADNRPWGPTRISTDAVDPDPDAYAQEKDLEASGVSLTIHQIPEPMTIALLGLGGLFLRRKK